MSRLATSGRHHKKACIPYSGEFIRNGLGGGTGGTEVATGVGVGSTNVAVGGKGVAVDSTKVAVSGKRVAVGGTGVSVGGIGVAVIKGRTGVELGEITCPEMVKVGRGVRVATGATGGAGLLKSNK